MAEVPIAVVWDSRRKLIEVAPEWALVCWGKGYEDTARWTLLSDESEVTMRLEFKTPDRKGPFEVLESVGPDQKQWRGAALKKQTRVDEYRVVLSNGMELDPGVRDQEFP